MNVKALCKEQVNVGVNRWRACKHHASKDGYCRQHHPDTKALREKEKADAWEARRQQIRAPFDKIERLEAEKAELLKQVMDLRQSLTQLERVKA